MKLQRESINLGSEYNGKWNFVIMDSDADKSKRLRKRYAKWPLASLSAAKIKPGATTATNALAMKTGMAPDSGFRSKMFRPSKRRTRQRRKQ
nr:hypothetical protein NNZKBPFO_HPZBYUEE_CDS_0011 [Przondovirus K11]